MVLRIREIVSIRDRSKMPFVPFKGVGKMNEGGPEESPPFVRRVVKANIGPQPTPSCWWVLIPFLVRGSTSKTILEGKTPQIYKAGAVA